MEDNTLSQYEYEVLTFASDVSEEDVLRTYEEILADRSLSTFTEGQSESGGLFMVNHVTVLEGLLDEFVSSEQYELAQRAKVCLEQLDGR